MGDSLSAGYGIARQAAWPSLLQQRIDTMAGDWRVVNASISGETSAGGRSRLPQALRQHRPGVVIIALGANDGLRGLGTEQMQRNLRTMIETSQRAGARVLLVGMRLPPNYGPAYTTAFASVFKALAHERKTAFTPFLLDAIATDPAAFQSDGIHPTADAQPQLLQTLWPALEPLLKQSSASPHPRAAPQQSGRQ